jgi:hypothetical protein
VQRFSLPGNQCQEESSPPKQSLRERQTGIDAMPGHVDHGRRLAAEVDIANVIGARTVIVVLVVSWIALTTTKPLGTNENGRND